MTSIRNSTQSTRNARKKLKLDGDVERGDPAKRIVGRTEQPARRHRRLPSKSKYINEHTIKYDVQMRLDELRPLLAEYDVLTRVLKALEKIK